MKKLIFRFSVCASIVALAFGYSTLSSEPRWKKASRLHEACADGRLDRIRDLIVDLGDPNGESMGDTALHVSTLNGKTGAISLLLELGANINAQDSRNQTALHSAVRNASKLQSGDRIAYESSASPEGLNLVKFLLDRGADESILDDEGRTPRDWAVSLGYSEVISLFDQD